MLPFIEEELKINGIEAKGKEYFSFTGELTIEDIKAGLIKAGVLINYAQVRVSQKEEIITRTPMLCAGCPHRPIFHILKANNATVIGDIGCYSLGIQEPFEVHKTNISMGASLGMALGVATVHSMINKGKPIVATKGDNPDIHPYWQPEFFGNTIMVNGTVWPNFNVKRCQYRLRLLNGSNARFYELNFSNNMPFIQIGSDGGYLSEPVTLTFLLIAPGERADILVDFSCLPSFTKLILENHASAPFPDGDVPDPNTVGSIMQFTVVFSFPETPGELPKKLNTIPKLIPDSLKRTLTLFEVMGDDGPLEVLLDGQKWIEINGEPPLDHPTEVLPVCKYLEGEPMPPESNEAGWKDTIRANPGEVTTLLIRFAPQDADPDLTVPGMNLYQFNPSSGPGYVWHCHIIDHEDNEMMRPYKVTSNNEMM